MIKVIVFDFDGVIVRGSEFNKERGWSMILPSGLDNEILAAREKYKGGRGSRFDILRELVPACGVETVKKEEWLVSKAEEYDKWTATAVIAEGVCPEDADALKKLKASYLLYMNSATPEPVLLKTVEKLGILYLFEGIFGQRNLNSKVENLERVTLDSGFDSKEVLFVGDQDTDFQAAQKFGCRFVGIMNDWNKWRKGDKSFPLINAVRDLPDFLTTV